MVRERGFAVFDGFLGRDQAEGARGAAQNIFRAGLMRRAGMGKDSTAWTDVRARGDEIIWMSSLLERKLSGDLSDEALTRSISCMEVCALLHDFRPSLSLQAVSDSIVSARDSLVTALSQTFTCEKATFQLARYAQGACYVRHSDVSETNAGRRLTCIYYFNPGWREEHGGVLRLYHPKEGLVDVAPLCDRLLLFLPDMEHEVLPCASERFAISGWLYGPSSFLESCQAFAARREEEEARPEEIFVSIVAYRDPECPKTVRDLFQKAKLPKRVHVGLISQVDFQDDEDCFLHEGDLPEGCEENVRETRFHWKEARGPCWARYLAQRLWAGEKYYLQIDSHMRFAEGWDEYLISQLGSCPSPKPVLSTYPPGYDRDHPVPQQSPSTLLCASQFGEEGMLRIAGKMLRQRPAAPRVSLFWAAGCSFSTSELLLEVPYDPSMKFLFFGEELTMLARMWTRGFDVFAPCHPVVFHCWDRSYRSSFKEVADPFDLRSRSLLRARSILRMGEGEETVRNGPSGQRARPEAPPKEATDKLSLHYNCYQLHSFFQNRNSWDCDFEEAQVSPMQVTSPPSLPLLSEIPLPGPGRRVRSRQGEEHGEFLR
ncbi:hypothetical protein GUITHDRAFT_71355 [Guillardia theta CCMP2712]|uniref:procollagen-lysine 5-dioxygenase n=1 Tax=Guillardia theta (strain CCMP2712) TaxID=905079 RepID=L1JAR2_GUITC|nr:hypothetical protein GUITHDRAFT_71355 [Guillardia theta CCMP2712]EKX45392.1 hypothetical protein GUITHDRAFT_71355 [Guillardia theta CCMP2712]|eukprot:XP_005832372.1 hypothetical protein GUITHDRAFT_71355 [Guillardia theta CCMP2712]